MKFLDEIGFSYFANRLKTMLGKKVDKVQGKGLSTEDYKTEEKEKLASVETGANRYTHPTKHPASIITETTTKRFVSDSEKDTWNAKETVNGAKSKAETALSDAKVYVDSKVQTNVPANAKFTETTINGKTGAISKVDIVALGIPAQDTIVDISGKADKTELHSHTNMTLLEGLSEVDNELYYKNKPVAPEKSAFTWGELRDVKTWGEMMGL